MKGQIITYRPRLDGLRFIAITLVLIHHFGGYLASFFDAGYYGVDLFFVLSGYLITAILLADTRDSFGAVYRSFLGRRALRIFPAYYALLVILVAIDFTPAREFFPSLVSYTFNYSAAKHLTEGSGNSLFYLWSLSVEEQFYLLWPPLVIALRGNKRALLGLTGVIVILGYSQLTWNIFPQLAPFNYTGLPNRMGSLGLGALGAVYCSWRPLPASVFKSGYVEAFAMAVLVAALLGTMSYRFFLMGIASLYFVLKAAQFEFKIGFIDRLLMHPWSIYIGTISYGIYLFHVPIGALIGRYMFDPVWASIPFQNFGPLGIVQWHSWVLKLPLYSGVSVAFAAASYRWFESPILRLKSRWFGIYNSRVVT